VNDYIIDQGRLHDIQWSSDNQRIAYTADAAVEDVIELYVVDVSGSPPWASERVNVTFSSFDQDVLWFGFSADSRWLAFVANQDDVDRFDLYIADVGGATPGAPVRVNPTTSEVAAPPPTVSWSPDGTRLLYLAEGALDGAGGLWVSNVDSGGAAAPVKVAAAYVAHWAPRGRKLAVINTQVYLVDLSGPSPAAPQLLSGTLDPAAGEELAWAPDGSRLAFRLTGGGFARLYVVATSGSDMGNPHEVDAVINGVLFNFTWSPDSSMIAYRGADGPELGVYVSEVLAAPTTPVRVSGNLVTSGSVDSFAWAPDSSRLLYLADQETDNKTELYVSRVACGQLITSWKLNQALVDDASGATWSPDGNWIAYAASVAFSDYDVFVVRADKPNGYTPQQVNTSSVASAPQWATPAPAPPLPPLCP
jgi:Tol biopolymer transport system component